MNKDRRKPPRLTAAYRKTQALRTASSFTTKLLKDQAPYMTDEEHVSCLYFIRYCNSLITQEYQGRAVC